MAIPGVRSVKVRFLGDASSLDKASKDAESSLSKFDSKVSALSVGILGVAAAGVAGLAALGEELDGAYDTIRINTGKTGTELGALETSFKNVARNVPADLATVSSAIAETSRLTNAGGTELEALTTQYLNLARVTGTDVTSAISDGNAALKAWQVDLKQQPVVLDQIFKATQLSGVSFTDFTGTLQKFAPTLRNAGFALDESIPLIAQLEKSGANTEKVLGALGIGAGKLAREGKNTARGVQDLLEQIKNAPSATKAAEIAVEGFGTKAGPTLADALRKGQLSMKDMTLAIAGSEETINKAASDTDDWKESLQTLKNNAVLALEGPAKKVFGWIGDKAVPALKSAFEWAEKNTGTLKVLGIVLGSVAATVLLVTAGLKAYNAIVLIIRAATIAWTALQWLLNVALNANPIGLVVLAVAALIAIGILLWKNWDKVVHGLGVAWDWIWDKLVGIGRWFRDTFWGKWIKGAIDSIRGYFDKLLKFISDIPGKIGGFFSSLGKIIAQPFLWAFNKIADIWNSTLGGFKLPDWVPGIGGASIPRMPHLAFLKEGGPYKAGHPYIVGEAGAELMVPNHNGKVISNKDLAAMAGGGGDTYIALELDDVVTPFVRVEIERSNRRTARRVVRIRPRAAGVSA